METQEVQTGIMVTSCHSIEWLAGVRWEDMKTLPFSKFWFSTAVIVLVVQLQSTAHLEDHGVDPSHKEHTNSLSWSSVAAVTLESSLRRGGFPQNLT
jgi:hypothetical protein